MKKSLVAILLIFALCISLSSCGKKKSDYHYNSNEDSNMENPEQTVPPPDKNEQTGINENDFIKTSVENISTFSANVNTATYTLFRKLVNSNYSLENIHLSLRNSFRTEEMINYFKYELQAPENNELFGRTVQIAPTPWNENSVLMMLGLKTEEVQTKDKNNLVFLIDVSGSMSSYDKLPLLQRTFEHLVNQLGPNDLISIVTYASGERVVLEGCEGNRKTEILNAINSLSASGSTNGEAGIQKAYQIAQKHFISGGNNRIILATDGDLNVGISNPQELREFIAEKRETGVFLSVLGYGTGNYRDDTLEALAHEGNGIYYYVDGEAEAEKIFTTDLTSALYTLAKDVKLQMQFNPEFIDSYRLIGYETRILNNEDFDNDKKDAGEVGAGHSIVVFYELILTGTSLETEEAWMKLAVRYKEPEANESQLEEYNIGKEAYTETPDNEFKFATAIIETSMIIINSKYKGDITLSSIINKLEDINTNDYYRKEFKDLLVKLQNRG